MRITGPCASVVPHFEMALCHWRTCWRHWRCQGSDRRWSYCICGTQPNQQVDIGKCIAILLTPDAMMRPASRESMGVWSTLSATADTLPRTPTLPGDKKHDMEWQVSE
jgi:hypothetical protein